MKCSRVAVGLAALSLVGASVVIGACGTWLFATGPETQVDRIVFSHRGHLTADLDCLTCHFEIYESTQLGENYRPLEEVCMQCHSDAREEGRCGMCHKNVQRAAPYPRRELHLHISHAAHIPLVEEDCARCHVQLPEPLEPVPMLPPMARCLSCHNHQEDYDAGRCEKCHEDLSRYRLRPVSDFSHANNWMRDHRLSARSSATTCARCHDQSFCADCHAATVATPVEMQWPERIDRDFIHRNDWLSRHSLEAREGNLLCARCHGENFCEQCHRVQRVTPDAVDPRNPHPSGWVAPGSAQLHGDEARRDISRCAACHDQAGQSICIECHRVGGIGGNPHPPRWNQRRSAREIADNPMCMYCHA